MAKDETAPKMKRKAYEKELRKLQVQLCHLQEWVKAKKLQGHHPVRRPRRRRQGRHHQGLDREGEPAGVPGVRAARAVRPAESPDVPAALYRAVSGRRRDRDLRPQLVQPRRRRICHGLLHAGGAQALPGIVPAGREIRRRRRHHPDQAVARGRDGGTGAPLRGAHRGSAAAVEAEPDGHRVLQSLVRLLAGARHDVRGDRHQARAMAADPLRRQATGAAERHLAYPQDDSVQEDVAATRSSCRSVPTRAATTTRPACAG